MPGYTAAVLLFIELISVIDGWTDGQLIESLTRNNNTNTNNEQNNNKTSSSSSTTPYFFSLDFRAWAEITSKLRPKCLDVLNISQILFTSHHYSLLEFKLNFTQGEKRAEFNNGWLLSEE